MPCVLVRVNGVSIGNVIDWDHPFINDEGILCGHVGMVLGDERLHLSIPIGLIDAHRNGIAANAVDDVKDHRNLRIRWPAVDASIAQKKQRTERTFFQTAT